MKFNRKIISEPQPIKKYISKKRLREDEIDFDKLRSYRLDRVRNELKKNNYMLSRPKFKGKYCLRVVMGNYNTKDFHIEELLRFLDAYQ